MGTIDCTKETSYPTGTIKTTLKIYLSKLSVRIFEYASRREKKPVAAPPASKLKTAVLYRRTQKASQEAGGADCSQKKEVSTVHPHQLRSANDSQVFQPPAVRFRVALPAQRCSFYKLPGKGDREQQLVVRGAEAPTAEPGDEAFRPGPRHF